MERYLIETPHTQQNCLDLLDQIDAQGYLFNFDWGCPAGVHTGWVVIEAENEAQARMAVPPLVGTGRESRVCTNSVRKHSPRCTRSKPPRRKPPARPRVGLRPHDENKGG
jgi:hypothetical protein